MIAYKIGELNSFSSFILSLIIFSLPFLSLIFLHLMSEEMSKKKRMNEES